MPREIEETYVNENLTDDQTDGIIGILSDGIYEYLKSNGFLRSDKGRGDRIKTLLRDIRSLSSSGFEEMEKSD